MGVEGGKGVGDGISVGVEDIEGVREAACDVAVGSGVGVTATAGRGVLVGAALADVATDSEGGVAPAKGVVGEAASEELERGARGRVAPAKDVVGETAGKVAGEQEANVSTNIVVQTKDRTTRNLILQSTEKDRASRPNVPVPESQK